MSDKLFDFPEVNYSMERESSVRMSNSQRDQIRSYFAQLGVVSAGEQFSVVAELTGVRLRNACDLDFDAANVLISLLQDKVVRFTSGNKGSSWADRDGDTWIDRL